MTPSVVEMTKDLALAQAQGGHLSVEELINCIERTHASLMQLRHDEVQSMAPQQQDEVDWKHSIREDGVMCLECKRWLKWLSTHHLKTHGLDIRSYRTKFGIPDWQSLAIKTLRDRHREVAHRSRFWEQAPTCQTGKQRRRKGSKQPVLGR